MFIVPVNQSDHVKTLLDVLSQYQAAVELGEKIDITWNCYKEGKQALEDNRRATEGK